MKLDDPIAYAKSCTNKRDAAHCACALETEISLGAEHDEFWYDCAETALAHLRLHHPGFWLLDAYKAPPRLSQGFRDAERIQDEPIMDMPIVPVPEYRPVEDLPALPRISRRTIGILAGAVCAITLALTQIPGPGPGVSQARSIPTASVTAWAPFLAACQSGPSPGQGNSLEPCACWKQNLQAVAIGADDALDIINAATSYTSEAAAYTVPENIGNLSARDAMNGCDLYQESP